MSVFNKSLFEKAFTGDISVKETINNDLIKCLRLKSSLLRHEGRISYSDSHSTTANALEGLTPRLLYEDVSVDFLNEFENHLLNRNVSYGSVGVYMRNIRTAYNEAVSKGVISKDNYPFGKKGYCIPQQRNNKVAISIKDVMQIIEYKAVMGSSQEKARDLWLFMYLTNGLNMKDVCLLKNSDVKPDLEGISFFRAKTSRTTKHNKKKIDVFYDEDTRSIIKEILSKHGTGLTNEDDYLFPILKPHTTPSDERRLIQNFTRFVNKNMGKVSREIGLSSIPKTNVARHTFVTIIINKGAPLTFVKDSVGHSSITTTEGYADSLPTDKKKEYSGYLIGKTTKNNTED